MTEEISGTIEEVIEQITKTLEKAKKSAELSGKIMQLIENEDFAVQMSVVCMVLSKVIINESDDLNEAMSYVSRMGHTLVEVIDKQVEAHAHDDGDDEKEGTLQ